MIHGWAIQLLSSYYTFIGSTTSCLHVANTSDNVFDHFYLQMLTVDIVTPATQSCCQIPLVSLDTDI